MSQTQQVWQELATAALIGSDRNSLSLPLADSTLGNLITQLDSSDREGNILGNAAIISLYNRAGSLPPNSNINLPTLASEEEKPRCSALAASHLAMMLAGQYQQVLPEWLEAITVANLRVPEEMLPDLLDYIQKNALPRFKASLRPVVGQRGEWLAAQNAFLDFADKIADPENSWQIGSKELRLQVLRQLRATDPAKALALVESTWAEDKAEDRAAFLEAFRVTVSMADEPFLERALDDKRKEVRSAAASLLGHLPESRLVQRMIERVKPLLNWKYDPKSKKSEIAVTLPEKCDKAMQRDGIDKPPSYSGIGEKTWWLQGMFEVIPPQFWLEYWTTTPDNLITVISRNSEWSKIMLSSLGAATRVHKDEVMAEAFVNFSLKNNSEGLIALIAILPYQKQEKIMLDTLQYNRNKFPQIIFYVTSGENIWSIELGRAFLHYLRDYILSDETIYNWETRNRLTQVARLIPTCLLNEAIEILPKEAKLWHYWKDHVENFLALLQFRADMLSALGK